MEPEPIAPAPSWGRVLAFTLGGGILGASTSALVTTFTYTKIYPEGLESQSVVERIVTYLLTMSVGASLGAANGFCKARYGKNMWRILLDV